MHEAVATTTETHRARLADVIAKHDLRAAVVSSYQAVSYFAGTHIITQAAVPDRLAFFVALDDAEAALLVCSLETSMVRSQTDVSDIEEYVEFADSPADSLAALLHKRGVTTGRVGIEGRRLPAESFERIKSALPDVELVGIDDEVEALQMVKDESEIELLRVAAQATLDAVEGGAASCAPGDSELKLCADITARMLQAGGLLEFLVFGIADRALQAHGEPIDRPLTEGDTWRIDLGARYSSGILSDLARTGIVGEPTARQEEIMSKLRTIQDAGFAALEPGRPASDVFEAVRAEYARQELPFIMPHVGHGLGIGLHEFPILEPKNKTPLEVGMVLNVEPIVMFPEHNECYHTEDLAAVTPDGPRLLTQPQSGLLRLGT